jgi:hypothetical protein
MALAVVAIALWSVFGCGSSERLDAATQAAGETATGTVDPGTCTTDWELAKGFNNLRCDVVLESGELVRQQVVPMEMGVIDDGSGDLLLTTNAEGVFFVDLSRPSATEEWVVTNARGG